MLDNDTTYQLQNPFATLNEKSTTEYVIFLVIFVCCVMFVVTVITMLVKCVLQAYISLSPTEQLNQLLEESNIEMLRAEYNTKQSADDHAKKGKSVPDGMRKSIIVETKGVNKDKLF